jgi:uncharacterized protein (TIGR02147 family)
MKDFNIYSYQDYRSLIRDYIDRRRSDNSKYSLSSFARRGGINSKAMISLVLEGKRNLGLSSVFKFAKAMQLSEKEGYYFSCLVSYNQAKTDSEKGDLIKILRSIKPSVKNFETERLQQEFFSHWYIPATFVLLQKETMPRGGKWVQGQFRQSVKMAEVKKAFEVLVGLGVAKWVGDDIQVSGETLRSTNEVQAFELRDFHRQMISHAIEALDLNVDERSISSLTLNLTSSEFHNMKEKIKNLRKEWLEDHECNIPEAKTFQFNIQLFPLTTEDQ